MGAKCDSDIVGQVSIFDYIDENKKHFCNDERINQIVNDIEQTWERIKGNFPTLKRSNKEYSVWSHVPYLGLRLTMIYSFDCEFHNIPSRYCLIGSEAIYNLFEGERMIASAKTLGIELSISATPNMIFISTLDVSKSKKQKGDIEEDE